MEEGTHILTDNSAVTLSWWSGTEKVQCHYELSLVMAFAREILILLIAALLAVQVFS